MTNKRNFKDRVNIEREVLHLINKSNISSIELAGLSTSALNNWETSNLLNKNLNSDRLNKIRVLIEEVSERLRLNSDKSRDVFESDELVARGTIDDCINYLKKSLTLAS